jgi:hypothetical protein
LATEAAALPDDQATPLVRFEMFTSLIQMRTFLDTLENGTAERRGPDVDDRNAHSEKRAQIIVMVLRTGGEARAATDGPLGG